MVVVVTKHRISVTNCHPTKCIGISIGCPYLRCICAIYRNREAITSAPIRVCIKVEIVKTVFRIYDWRALNRLRKCHTTDRNQGGRANRARGRGGNLHQSTCTKTAVETDIDVAAICDNRRGSAVAGICFVANCVAQLRAPRECRYAVAANSVAINITDAAALGRKIQFAVLGHNGRAYIASGISINAGQRDAGGIDIRIRRCAKAVSHGTIIEIAAVAAEVNLFANSNCTAPVEALVNGGYRLNRVTIIRGTRNVCNLHLVITARLRAAFNGAIANPSAK